jgi:3-phenylpropionate/trans-cinnamate dioxygenase ferredoxin reductase subunit
VTEYLETEEKGIYAVGDLAFYPDRMMGGVRRQTHWENAREQGLVAGANMTGKKRIRYEQIPYFWTEMFDLKLEFVGDFNAHPTRVELRGTYAKKKFVTRYYQGDRLRGLLLCQAAPREVESARTELRTALGK